MNVEKLDLNLFKALVASYEERQVTAAAQRLGVTQPGLSHALARLRDLTGDELFIRRPDGMVPTAAAKDLYARVRPGLQLIQDSLAPPESFEPARLERSFVLGMNDYGASVLLPRLIRHVTAIAPQVRLRTRHFAHGSQHEALRGGDIDLSITVGDNQPGWTNQALLFEETALVVAAAGNPHLGPRKGKGKRMTLAAYTACPHVIMAPDGDARNWIDDLLADLGKSRTIQHTVPHFLAIPAILKDSTMISTLPRRLALRLASEDGLETYEPPFAAPPHRIVQVWPKRLDRDPLHRWLRGAVREAAATID
ncbi:MAG: LysR family transcriptional regulator [Kiloniellaceae bacterium]